MVVLVMVRTMSVAYVRTPITVLRRCLFEGDVFIRDDGNNEKVNIQ